MDTPTTILQTIQRVERLRAEAQQLWLQTQMFHSEAPDEQVHYAELMRQHQQLLTQLHVALVEATDELVE